MKIVIYRLIGSIKFCAIFLLLIQINCMTLLTVKLSNYWEYEKIKKNNLKECMFCPRFIVYSGTMNDIALFYMFAFRSPSFPDPAFLPFFIDLPLSFTADTLLLPVTVPVSIFYSRRINQEKMLLDSIQDGKPAQVQSLIESEENDFSQD